MRIAFIKGDGRPDAVQVTLEGGAESRWRAPGGPGMPHDLVHHVVEEQLELREGFWGLVAAGVNFGAVNASAEGGGSGLGGRDTTELLQSEAVTGALMQAAMAPGLGSEELLDHVRVQAERTGVPPPELDRDGLEALLAAFEHRRGDWEAVTPGGALVLGRPGVTGSP